MIFVIFEALASESEPPKTVKSCLAVVPDEFIQLLERTFIEKQIDALARAELARFVLAFAALGSAAFFGFRVALAKLVERVVALQILGRFCHVFGLRRPATDVSIRLYTRAVFSVSCVEF
jgi:hypothetical protein